MTLAIMQPYLFPYIGYYQLIHAADKFVFYDDVNFIKQGWINRNRILQSGEPNYFTLPVKNSSSFNKICDTQIDEKSFGLWRKKFFKTLEFNYSKAPHYKDVIELIQNCISAEANLIKDVARKSVVDIAAYLNIKTEIVESSSVYVNSNFSAQQRVIDICKTEKATTYINVSGGISLYSFDDFLKESIQLNFIKTNTITYYQFDETFHSSLSIIDVLMFCSKEQIQSFLEEYSIIKKVD